MPYRLKSDERLSFDPESFSRVSEFFLVFALTLGGSILTIEYAEEIAAILEDTMVISLPLITLALVLYLTTHKKD